MSYSLTLKLQLLYKGSFLCWCKNWQQNFPFRENFSYHENKFCGECRYGEIGLVGQGNAIRITRFMLQTPLETSLDLGIQPRYEAP